MDRLNLTPSVAIPAAGLAAPLSARRSQTPLSAASAVSSAVSFTGADDEKSAVGSGGSSSPASDIDPTDRNGNRWPCPFDVAAARLQSQKLAASVKSRQQQAGDDGGWNGQYDADVILVGAGVAGCALAAALGRQGRRVLLVESSLAEPNKIVGELMQPGGIGALTRIGLGDALKGIDGITTRGYCVLYTDTAVLPYQAEQPTSPDQPSQPDRQRQRAKGIAFHHGRFIQRLRHGAQISPNVRFVEAQVNGLITNPVDKSIVGIECTPAAPDGSKPTVRDEPLSLYAPLTFAVNGYSSFLRKQYLTPNPPAFKSRFWGAVLYDVTLPHPEHGHVLLSTQKPVLMYQIGSAETRILVDVPRDLPAEYSMPLPGETGTWLPAHRYMRLNVLPFLPANLQAEFGRVLDQKQFQSMPNNWLPAAQNTRPGLVFLGDSFNMRHPLTGGGMTVALKDVEMVTACLAKVDRLDSHRDVQSAVRQWQTDRKRFASVINTLAQALYAVFSDSDARGIALRDGCFDYFLCGEDYYRDPVRLLSGMAEKKWLLLYHFFAVAFYSIRMAAYKTAASWTGLSAFFDPDSVASPSGSGMYGGVGGDQTAAAARAAGCPAFASSQPTSSSSIPTGHPNIGPEQMDRMSIPAECPMSAMYAGPKSTSGMGMNMSMAGAGGGSRLGQVPAWYMGLVFLALVPVAWMVNAVPLLYRACVVIGPVILTELLA